MCLDIWIELKERVVININELDKRDEEVALNDEGRIERKQLFIELKKR